MRFHIAVCAILGLASAVSGDDEDGVIQKKRVPFMASLHYNGHFFCGGAIVSDRFILTTAECVNRKDADKMVVRVGSTHVNGSGVTYEAVIAIVHPKFTTVEKDYDVGLVKTRKTIEYRRGEIEPVPVGNRRPDEGTVIMIAGWGALHKGGPPSSYLQAATVVVSDQAMCAREYKDGLDVTPRMFCSSSKDEGACVGDNGGPAVQSERLVGVISHRVGCGRNKLPDVYADLTEPSIQKFIRLVLRT